MSSTTGTRESSPVESIADVFKSAVAQGAQDHQDKEKSSAIVDVFKSAKAQANLEAHPDIEKNGEFAGLSVTTMANVSKFAKALPRQEYKDVLSFSEVHKTGSFTTLIVPLVLVLGALLIPAYCVPLVIDGEVPTVKVFLPIGMACIVAFPMLFFLKWIGRLLMDSFDFDDEFADDSEAETGGRFSCPKPSMPMICLAIAIVFRQANYLVEITWVDTAYVDFYKLLLNLGCAMSFFVASISGLDSLHQSIEKFCHRLDSISRNKRSHQAYKAMKQMRSFNDKDKDGSARIPGGHRSPAVVLGDIVGIYCNVAKMLSVTLLVFYFLDFNLTSNLVVIGLAIIFAGIIQKLDLQNALVNVLALSVSNTVHIGELICLGSPGGGNPNPGDNVMGYFEGCTWGHVIIRDFGRNAIYIRHEKFMGLTLSNWSRCPNKSVSFTIPVVAELSGGTDGLVKLAEYAKEWMNKHPFIDQTLMKKAFIKWGGKGLVLDVTFYVATGGKPKDITAEFTVVILEAAKRLKLVLTPAEIRMEAPGFIAAPKLDILDAVDLSDLDPSPELTAKAGIKPKHH